ncbi:hypothetical protein DDB_G0292360 [Dictyostelium discoideum AX4]|uniref:Uncharacterized protein DDB_G0292360 n=1 Tax=Dictyostelium discoideum TaxID=44689 RepID=Y9734_DICDI|nr:hypothetical protein DDB_G0292360 [Dictyostelium discoideum AX4]Q54DD5.1 RecName: Full=Uncharacterized protein DDB_G0292360; Flags: Precursor [Dictyostelium discoideum]EAL61304.1 hypothetical protein DDB_G0292360 [Dictyostelium discoideum AX4]|eukprot:XP_629706.1 hypothetical protein DDB_G0292360 [Dictyostelium discoideum AX4]
MNRALILTFVLFFALFAISSAVNVENDFSSPVSQFCATLSELKCWINNICFWSTADKKCKPLH